MRLALGLACMLACGSAEPPPAREQGAAEVGGTVVSTVDGQPIELAEVERFATAAELSAEDALARLQAELLLAGEATRLGYGDAPEVARAQRRALVQALLARVDEEVPEVSDDEVRSAFEERWDSLYLPQRRRCDHLLLRVERTAEESEIAAARARMTETLETLRRDPNQWAAIGAQEGVLAESLPAVPRSAPLDTAFAAALFDAEDVGVLPELVQSAFGFHVIALREILPAEDPRFEDHREAIREELMVQRRFRRLTDLVAGLEESIGVDRNEAALGRALELSL
ncbi:MAG: peptidylprolyl isomerase [Myxococcota bacterium]